MTHRNIIDLQAARWRRLPCRQVSLQETVAALSQPAAYVDAHTVRAIETHYSWVFLTEQHAYELKRPLRTEDFDLGSVVARGAACAAELRLNRRLAGRVYSGTVPVTLEGNGAIRVQGQGLIVDWLVKMQRLPRTLMLDHAIEARNVSPEQLHAVGVLLADFYRSQPPVALQPSAYWSRIARGIASDQLQLSSAELGLPRMLIDSTAERQRSALLRLKNEVMQRARQYRIVEAHGDLRPEHVCLANPPCIIDALDFSLDLRTLDPAEELAFLYIECARAGAAWVGNDVWKAYRAATADSASERLLDLYRSRRAIVRAKLVAWHLRGPQVKTRANWHARAQEYLEMAREYAQRALE